MIILKQTENTTYLGQSVPRILKQMVTVEGPMSLFKGNGTNVLRIMPHSAIELYSFELYKMMFASLGLPSFSQKQQYLVGGALAGITATAFVYPLDLVRTIFAYQTHSNTQYNGIWQTWKTIVNQNGIRALYRGLGMTCCGIAPYASLKLTIFQILKNWFYESGPSGERQLSNFANLWFGALSGCLAVSITYPTDLIRRKIQVASFKNDGLKRDIRSVIKRTYSTYGIRGFYQGLGVTYMKVIPSVALTFMINEQIKNLFNLTSKA